MTEKALTPILHLVGPDGSGKTTLCRLFLDAVIGRSVLAVDASPDRHLTESYALPVPLTVADLLAKCGTNVMSREAIDWALQDLPMPVPAAEDAQILVWGELLIPLGDTQQAVLSYGLPRLFAHYDVVVWDGPLAIAHDLPAVSDWHPLVVVTPADDAYCRTLSLPHAMLLLSKAEPTDSLPEAAKARVASGEWTYIGKLPPIVPAEKRVRELPQYVQDCFSKLDLPFAL